MQFNVNIFRYLFKINENLFLCKNFDIIVILGLFLIVNLNLEIIKMFFDEYMIKLKWNIIEQQSSKV